MADMSITFGQLSLDIPEPTPIAEPTETFMDEWRNAAMEVVSDTPAMQSACRLLVNNKDNSKFIDMRRCNGIDDYEIFNMVMDADAKYLTMRDCAIAVILEPSMDNYHWIVLYRGVQLPEAITSTKIEKSMTAFTYMHMERMRRIANHYGAETIMDIHSVRVTRSGQTLAVLALSTKRPESLIKFDFTEHTYENTGGSTMTVYSAVLPAIESDLYANRTMEKIWMKLKELFPNEEVYYNIYGNGSSIYVDSDRTITYLGAYKSAVAAMHEGMPRQCEGVHLYMDKTNNANTGFTRYYLVSNRFPIYLPNMTNCGDKLMEVMKVFNAAVYKKHVNKPITRKIKGDIYVISNIPANSEVSTEDYHEYGAMWIEDTNKPQCIAQFDETIQVYPYANNTRIVTCVYE